MKRRLTGGRIMAPAQGLDAVMDLWLDGDQIVALGDPPAAANDFTPQDVSGLWLLPTLWDVSADLTRHTGNELAAAIAGGVDTVVCAPTGHNPLDSAAMVEHLLREGAGQPGRLIPLGALTRALAGQQLTDYAALADAGCLGLSNGGQPLADSAVLRNALKYAASLDLPVFLHPVDPALSNGCAHEGPIATRLGLPSVPAVAEVLGLVRDLELVADTGARVHFTRLSCARSVRVLKAAQADGLPVTADVAMAQLFLSEHDLIDFNALCHLTPPLRSTTDRQGLIDGVASGVISAICSDHQPIAADAKLAPFEATEPGMSGLETLLALGMRLVDDGTLDLAVLLAALTSGPARIFTLPAPAVSAGQPCRLLLWDPEPRWRPGQHPWVSRGSCSPFSSWELKGKVRGLL